MPDPDLIAEAREFMDPTVGYAWTSWWDQRQAGALINRLIEALEGEGNA